MGKARNLAKLIVDGGGAISTTNLTNTPAPSWTVVTGKPTTVSGFGITDMASQSVASAVNATNATNATSATTATTATNVTNVTTTQVSNAIAGASFGGVGTYGLFKINTTGITEGATYAGSSLFPAGYDSANNTDADNQASATAGGTAVSGTWRLMGRNFAVSGSAFARYSVFLRIA